MSAGDNVTQYLCPHSGTCPLLEITSDLPEGTITIENLKTESKGLKGFLKDLAIEKRAHLYGQCLRGKHAVEKEITDVDNCIHLDEFLYNLAKISS